MEEAMQNKTIESNSHRTLSIVMRALRAQGANIEKELGRVGLPWGEGQDPDGRVCRDAYVALWRRFAELSGDPDCGLRFAQDLRPGTMGVLEYACVNASTVAQACQRLARYGRLLHDGGHHEFHVEDTCGRFVYRAPKSSPVPRALIDWSFGYFFFAARRATAAERPARELRVQYRAPADRSYLERLFGCPIEYGCDVNELILERELLDAPLNTADPTLGELMDDLAARRLAELPQSIADSSLDPMRMEALPRSLRRVAQLLMGDLSEKQIAAELGLTYHTVHTYARRIYKHCQVQGRIELMARIIDTLGGMPDEDEPGNRH